MRGLRKDLRIKLPVSAMDDFKKAKLRVEHHLGITIRDKEFATRLIAQAVRPQQKLAVRYPNIIDDLNKPAEPLNRVSREGSMLGPALRPAPKG